MLQRAELLEEKDTVWPEPLPDRARSLQPETREERLEDIKAPRTPEKEKSRSLRQLAGLKKNLERRLHDTEQELACLRAVESKHTQSSLEKALKDRDIITTSARNITSFNIEFLRKKWDAASNELPLLAMIGATELLVGGFVGGALAGLVFSALGLPVGAALAIGIPAGLLTACLVDMTFQNDGFGDTELHLKDYALFFAAPVRYLLAPLTDFLPRKGIFRAARYIRSVKNAELDTDRIDAALKSRIGQLEALADAAGDEISTLDAEIRQRKEQRKAQRTAQETPSVLEDRTEKVEARREELGRSCMNQARELLLEFENLETNPDEAARLTEILAGKESEYLGGEGVVIKGETSTIRFLNACLSSGPLLSREQREEIFPAFMAALEKRQER